MDNMGFYRDYLGFVWGLCENIVETTKSKLQSRRSHASVRFWKAKYLSVKLRNLDMDPWSLGHGVKQHNV